jgi:hypothetical protein
MGAVGFSRRWAAVEVHYKQLGVGTLSDVACCPGGLELKGRTFRGNLEQAAEWHCRMIEVGMRGVVAYMGDEPRGFAEYMPAEVAPVPIEASDAAILMCYHWVGMKAEDPEHLTRERKLIERVIEETRPHYSDLVDYDGALAVQNLLLAAHAVGYGSCVQTSLFPEELVRDHFGVPTDHRFVCAVPVGKAAALPGDPGRRPLHELVWRERYSGDGG